MRKRVCGRGDVHAVCVSCTLSPTLSRLRERVGERVDGAACGLALFNIAWMHRAGNGSAGPGGQMGDGEDGYGERWDVRLHFIWPRLRGLPVGTGKYAIFEMRGWYCGEKAISTNQSNYFRHARYWGGGHVE